MSDDHLARVLASTAEMLRARGDRMTGPRRAVLTALVEQASHLSPEQVVNAVALVDPTVHRASVYRALEALSGLGILQHVHLGHGTTAYHLADPQEHLHAHCTECGRVIDLAGGLLDAVAATLLRDHGFHLNPSHVALSGICVDCALDAR